ncbi:MAG TPA: 2-C-methyl-D-erythritol 4-phosphate cytidylyltransferase [Patescibacteria group bacterium]|nr:2-C-methyl-D-erythritol 4-phosphate cytidylyltransferase [Patescibacteria group bacterium]
MAVAIIPAAGQGRRMGSGVNKAFLTLAGEPILLRTVRILAQCSNIGRLIVVAAPEETETVTGMLLSLNKLTLPWLVVAGGSERQYSVANALAMVTEEDKIVLVHDGARPLVDPKNVEEVIEAARQHGAAILAVPVKDTVKQVDEEGFVKATPERKELWNVQTPQAFTGEVLKRAHAAARRDDFLGTDEASLVERLNIKVKIVAGSDRNIKITTPADIAVAQRLLNDSAVPGTVLPVLGFRCGMGYDVHRLVTGRKLILGGVEIPHTHGLDGHSDADVLLHAIKDALLGAAALGDIGRHFPDTDGRYRGISSLLLLAEVRDLVTGAGYQVNNLDATVVAQKPKLAPFIETMRTNIAATLRIENNQVNVKATTTEELGFAGRREGIAAYATATLIPC